MKLGALFIALAALAGCAGNRGEVCVAAGELDVRLANRECVDWSGPQKVREDVSFIVEWAGSSEQPDLSLIWSDKFPVALDWDTEEVSVDGCTFFRSVVTPERPLSVGEDYAMSLSPKGAVTAGCDADFAELQSTTLTVKDSGTTYTFCGDDRPSCATDNNCPAPWVCAPDRGRCHIYREPSCWSSDDSRQTCANELGDPDARCVSVAECGDYIHHSPPICARPDDQCADEPLQPGGICDSQIGSP